MRHQMHGLRRCATALYLFAGLLPASGITHAAEPGELPKVEVIGTTPLPGLGLARDLVPAPVQSASDADMRRANAINLSDFLDRNLGSVHINEIQNNPFQPDVNYRGFTASPLLGTPQGLSVYMDGVRMNQPFGDVVSWDLIPKSAIANLTLMPGSNPLFGLNTLGGALSIQTKDGRSHPGAALQAYGGINRRRATEFEYGGFNQTLDWFVTGNYFRERGWRDDSPTRVGQLFGKLGWRNAATDLKFTIAHANNRLTGNGLQEFRLLNANYASIYTKPDVTGNISTLLGLALNHAIGDNLVLSGNAYYRRMRTRTLNGDINEESLSENIYRAGETAANTPFPSSRCIEQVLLNDEPGENCNALINRSSTRQSNLGFSAQLAATGNTGGIRHQFTGGGAYDGSRAHFTQSTQLGYLTPARGVTGLNAFADGVSGGEVDGEPLDNRVDLRGRTRTWSAYATDTMSFANWIHLTVSGRFNRTTVNNRDQINPGGSAGSLDGNHNFSRFNPAAGVSFTPHRAFKTYAGYSEGSRAPSAIELGCADPNNPCRLPNSLAGDPPLKQVVTKTWELGMHGLLGGGLRWNAGVFRAQNHDDILFVAAPDNTQFGYFRNFGKTRREGAEAGFTAQSGALNFGANYTYIDATYRSAESLNGTGNSTNDLAQAGEAGREGAIRVNPGTRIPLIPRHLFKAHADYQFTGAFSAGLNMIAVASSFARGNENNLHQPDGTVYLGSGKSPGYAVFNFSAGYQVDKQLRFFARINNLFDRKYSTGAQLGPTGFTANGNFIAQPLPPTPAGEDPVVQSTFFAPGAPRTGWIGLRYLFDMPARKP